MNLTLILGAALLVAALIFSVQNAGAVDVRCLVWNFSTSLAMVMFGAFAAGWVGGWAITSALRRPSQIAKSLPTPLQPPSMISGLGLLLSEATTPIVLFGRIALVQPHME